jgi:hypothetical protein
VTKPRITHGSVQTRRYPRRSLSPHPRRTWTHAAFRALVMPDSGRCSLAWLSADPYIPVARDDRDGTVHNVWADAGKRRELAMKLVDVGRLNPGRSDERLRPQASTQLASSVHLNVECLAMELRVRAPGRRQRSARC